MPRFFLIAAAVSAAVLLSGCRTETPPADADGPVAILETYEDVSYYIGCANEPVLVGETLWYPVTEWGDRDLADLHADIMSLDRERPPGRAAGFAPRVAEPGPGDDIGTVYVYADGYAYFESDSGLSTWLTTNELEYNWVC